LNIIANVKQSAQVEIYDVMNQLVFETAEQRFGASALAVDVSAFPVGMYTARVRFEDGTSLSQKVMVGR